LADAQELLTGTNERDNDGCGVSGSGKRKALVRPAAEGAAFVMKECGE